MRSKYPRNILLDFEHKTSVQVAYPVSASLTTGVLWSGAQITTLLLVIFIDGPLSLKIDGSDPPMYNLEPGMWLMVSVMAAAAVLAWLWTGKCASVPVPPFYICK